MSDTTSWAIAWPMQDGANVIYNTRYVIDDVPVDVTMAEVLAWVDNPSVHDHAFSEDEWSVTVQLTARAAPRVKWRGRASRSTVTG